MNFNKFGFIGPGKMAKSIINGIVSTNFQDAENLYIYGRSDEKMLYFADLGCKTCTDIQELFQNCNIIFICVKPQNIDELFEIMKPEVANNILFISIVAGLTSKRVRECFGYEAKLIRVMPNTATLIGHGAAALSKTENVSDEEFSLIKNVFSSCGIAVEVSEDLQDAVINISGSTPAYIYYISKLITDFAVENGVSYDVARELFSQTLLGCAVMMKETKLTESELIDMVASKGGTTRAALDAFDENFLDKAFLKGLLACKNRAEELGRGK